MPLSVADSERAERTLKRAIIKRDTTIKHMQLLYEMAQKVETDEDVLPIFRARKKDLESTVKAFHVEQNNIIDQLVELGREKEFDKDHASLETKISEQYYFIIAIADTIDINESPSSASTKNESLHIQLPKIQLPNFDGDLLQWCAFRDTFSSLVHENVNLSDIERFHYLLSTVSGSASAVVRSIPLSDDNYKVAWKALNERFDNKRLIMNAHLDKLFNFPPLKSSSLTELKSFLDIFQENISALTTFDIPDKVGFLLFYIAARSLDSDTKCLFESEYKNTALPVITDLLQFIKMRCHILQNSTSSSASLSSIKIKPSSGKNTTSSIRTSLVIASSEYAKQCPFCQKLHSLYKCDKFCQLSPAKRLKLVQSKRFCTNCLSASHTSSACTSKYVCRQCSARHHTLLHLGQNERKPSSNKSSNNQSPSNTTPTTPNDQSSAFVGAVNSVNLNVLGTALIRIRDKFGQWIPVRALIDSGSQISAVTHTCATQLGLIRRHNNVTVLGISQSLAIQSKGSVICNFIPHAASCPELTCEPVILSKITGFMPSAVFSPKIRATYSDVQFADPSFDRPDRIDFLIGADLYNRIFEKGYQIRHEIGLPSAFETILGWIFVGTASQVVSPSSRVCLKVSLEPSLHQLLHRFWECEEPVVQSIPFTEEEKCEDIFRRTTMRDNTGRYIVSFPFKMDPSVLGDSRAMAVSRFLNLERKLQEDPDVYSEYRLFMHEYLTLGHMKIASTLGKYIIPHHAVVKHVNNKIKLRVVFDASARTSSGVSLNDTLFVGPKLQCDIMNLLIRCRLHKYMFTADICKMYRQIKVSSTDCEYQHILWRNNPSEPLLEYELSTVTYGVASSPFQAIRVLHQLEDDEGDPYPEARSVLSTQTYVDDIISGAETIEKTLLLQQQVTQLLNRGGLDLKKWASNCQEVLHNVPTQDRVAELSFDPKDNCSVKILGLYWDPILDIFSYHSEPFTSFPTKRSVLSAIAKIYDPLGTLAPITFWAKCFMQILWKNGYEWDQPISEELSSSWKRFSDELPCVSLVKIQRHIPMLQSSQAQLLGFSDASVKGFAAVVYIRLEHTAKPSTIHLVTAKSKVAPLKSGQMNESLTIPRLELCGALLLAQTLHRVQQILSSRFEISTVHAWTDSTVVLSWLTAHQTHFKIFVTNRLKRIAELLPYCQWHYVNTHQNPADCVSRGLFPNEALSHHIYWNGPEFLKQSLSCWSSMNFNVLPEDQLPECKPKLEAVHLVTIPTLEQDWLERFSTLTRLQRTLIHMRRFIYRARCLPTYSGFIRHIELEEALKILVKVTQSQEFHTLFKSLASGSYTVISPALARLAPFVDPDGIIRVGGRLRNSNATEDFKCPILLPKVSVLTTLLVRHYHIQYLHAGPQLVASLLSTRFWILSSRSVIRHLIFKCVVCTRYRAANPTPIMGDLPSARVRPSRPFSNVGIDYAGPLPFKDGKRRNARSSKCYLAIFVCMVIKAIHIEVVTDLSTAAFIAALHRFVSRRGIPSHIFSDCGTNFKGADSELRSLLRDPLSHKLFLETIPCQWHFNPPASPHFGGLWEAAVKSTKYHLKRVIGPQILTYEELCTLTNRIEAVLNSRPITPQSTDPNDLRALTPGDFLIGCPLVAIPEPNLTTTPTNRLTRWQIIKQFHQSFWKRWSAEYLTTLQGRSKWYRRQTNLQVGDLVLVHASNVPPSSWKLGRIDSVHPGEDGVVRVATVRTKDGLHKRPVVKLAVLPITEATVPNNS